MKIINCLLVAMLAPISAFAQVEAVAGGTQATANAQTESVAESQVQGNEMGNLYYAPVTNAEATKMRSNSAFAPSITTSNDTCMGSTSAGVTTYGISISAGSTWTDNNCVMLKNSRELWNMGMRDAAIARMCMDDLNRDALEVTGIKCPNFEELRKNRNSK